MSDDRSRERDVRAEWTHSVDEMLARARKRQAKADLDNSRRRANRAQRRPSSPPQKKAR